MKFKVVKTAASETPLAVDALEKIDEEVIRRQIVKMHHQVSSPPLRHPLRTVPIITGKSPSIGMGMEISAQTHRTHIALDDVLLEKVLANQSNESLHAKTARYFILTSAGYTLVKDKPAVFKRMPEGAYTVVKTAWQWGARLALEHMGVAPKIEEAIIAPIRQEYMDQEVTYADDLLHYTYVAELAGVQQPNIKKVDPWLVGMAFPMPELPVGWA